MLTRCAEDSSAVVLTAFSVPVEHVMGPVPLEK